MALRGVRRPGREGAGSMSREVQGQYRDAFRRRAFGRYIHAVSRHLTLSNDPCFLVVFFLDSIRSK